METMSASASECAWQVAHHHYARRQKRKIETKKRKKFFGVEVCALACARVGVQGKVVDGHRERGNPAAKFVEPANNLQVTAG